MWLAAARRAADSGQSEASSGRARYATWSGDETRKAKWSGDPCRSATVALRQAEAGAGTWKKTCPTGNFTLLGKFTIQASFSKTALAPMRKVGHCASSGLRRPRWTSGRVRTPRDSAGYIVIGDSPYTRGVPPRRDARDWSRNTPVGGMDRSTTVRKASGAGTPEDSHDDPGAIPDLGTPLCRWGGRQTVDHAHGQATEQLRR